MENMKKKELSKVSGHCANYTTGYICLGAMIGRQLDQVIDSEYAGKVCKLKKGEECEYFEQIVKPSL